MDSSTLEHPLSAERSEKQPTILIVEDEQSLADVLAFWLRRQGYHTRWAPDGAAGVEVARRDRPDLVILDVCLPDADGLTICEILADSPQTCDIPVIILSGVDQPDIIRRARGAGCRFYVRKPCDPNALMILIRQAIDDARAWRFDEPLDEAADSPFDGWPATEFDEPV